MTISSLVSMGATLPLSERLSLMSNTITLTRGEWSIITLAIDNYLAIANLRGGYIENLLQEIDRQLDKQEY